MLGLHASHELFSPAALLQAVRLANAAGFQSAMCSDHFHPWTAEPHAQSGFAWSWLGAAMAMTRLSFGVVNAPGQRYHPAIVAQAAATLSAMFPRRFWLAVGSGEAVNESITGEPWPSKEQRQLRLQESVEVIRALWRGETVTHTGFVRVAAARLATRPEVPPLLIGAAITEETAEWVGSWADGLITVGSDTASLRANVEAFRRGGGRGKPTKLQLTFAYAPTECAALALSRARWRHAALDSTQLADLETPEDFDRATAYVTPGELQSRIRVASEMSEICFWIEEALALGIDDVYLSPIVEDLYGFVALAADHVIPRLRTHDTQVGAPR